MLIKSPKIRRTRKRKRTRTLTLEARETAKEVDLVAKRRKKVAMVETAKTLSKKS